MVSPSTKRRAVQEVVAAGLGQTSQACRALGLARSSFYRPKQQSLPSRKVQAEVIRLSKEHPRYGYRRISPLMRRAGIQVNQKRVQRIRRKEGLQVRKRQRRMKRLGTSTAERQRAERPNHVWSWDFVHDQTANGSNFRILTVLDEHTRKLVAIHAAWSIKAVDVIAVVDRAIARYGCPTHLRSDNGPEFIAYAIEDWVKQREIDTLYIRPGSPWEQAYIESFHDKLRDECLNREWFGSLLEARVILDQWRSEYNNQRPHSSLNYATPNEYAASLIGHGRPDRVRGSDEHGLAHSRRAPSHGLLPITQPSGSTDSRKQK